MYRPVAAPDGSVLVTTFAGDILCVSPAEGTVRWRVRDRTPSMLPAAAGGTVVTATFGAVMRARSLRDGHLQWTARLPARPSHPPRVRKGLVAVADETGSVTVFSERSGAEVWRVSPGWPLAAAPLPARDHVIVFRSGGDPPALFHRDVSATP